MSHSGALGKTQDGSSIKHSFPHLLAPSHSTPSPFTLNAESGVWVTLCKEESFYSLLLMHQGGKLTSGAWGSHLQLLRRWNWAEQAMLSGCSHSSWKDHWRSHSQSTFCKIASIQPIWCLLVMESCLNCPTNRGKDCQGSLQSSMQMEKKNGMWFFCCFFFFPGELVNVSLKAAMCRYPSPWARLGLGTGLNTLGGW